jgi:hypothetical protein
MSLINSIPVSIPVSVPDATIAGDQPLAAWRVGRVYRCAWCHCAGAVTGGLPYYTFRGDGQRVAAPPDDWSGGSGSDGICPAHLAAVLAHRRAGAIAA